MKTTEESCKLNAIRTVQRGVADLLLVALSTLVDALFYVHTIGFRGN